MIVFRYLAKNVAATMVAVTFVLLLIIMSGRFIKYLAEAATGKFAADVLIAIMGYRMPEFLALIIPLGMFLGILMAYGRLYLDSEMTVLGACGFSYRRLLIYTLIPGFMVAAFTGYLSLQAVPWGAKKAEEIFRAQAERTEFDTLIPGRFRDFGSQGTRVTYAERLSDDRKTMKNVFISQRGEQLAGAGGDAGNSSAISLLVAETATQYIDEKTGSHFLLLENGFRYDGSPGDVNYRVIRYQKHGIRIPKPDGSGRRLKSEHKTTAELWGSDDPEDIAQLQWRLSQPILVPIVTLMAVPLSRVNPRQGRYMRLLPAIFLYMGYLVILSTARSAIEDGELSTTFGLWWVHLLFLAIGLALVANIYRRSPLFGKIIGLFSVGRKHAPS